MLELDRMDPYVLWVLRKNGWTPERVFPEAEVCMERIAALGFPPVDYGVRVLRSLGGLRFREYGPLTYEKLAESWREGEISPGRRPDASRIRESCQAALTALGELGLDPEGYTGATFTFDALAAAGDVEIVIDTDLAREVIGRPIFPIGTVEPDGVVFAAADGGVYVLFDDGIFSAGSCVEEFLHILFVRGCHPRKIYSLER